MIEAENPLRHPPLVERIEQPVAVHFPATFSGYVGKRYVYRDFSAGEVRLGPASTEMLNVCLEALFASVERLTEWQDRPKTGKIIFVPHFASFHFENDLVHVPAGGSAISLRDGWRVMLSYRIDLYDSEWRPIGNVQVPGHHMSVTRAFESGELKELIGLALRDAAREFLARMGGNRDVRKVLLSEQAFRDWEASRPTLRPSPPEGPQIPQGDDYLVNCFSGGKRDWVLASRCD